MEDKQTSSPASHADESVRWSKQDFLDTYASRGEYGYGTCSGASGGPEQMTALQVDDLRAKVFSNLLHPESNREGLVYLDHAGATLYSRSQIACNTQMLLDGVYGNPHSKGPAASMTADQVKSVRGAILDHFHASPEEWAVVFTSGATASFKLLAESFPWSRDSYLYYAHNSHTSVLGMREYAVGAGACFKCLPSDPTQLLSQLLDGYDDNACVKEGEEGSLLHDDMLVLPAECNFSGKKIDTSLLPLLPRRRNPGQRRRLWVTLDAAKHVATSPLDLSSGCCLAMVDAVCLSFYKMFGYPTGLGCLIVRRELAHLLTGKAYFGGGTVQAALPDGRFQVLRSEPERRLADGTENFLAIMAVKTGLDVLRERGGMARIQAHTFALTRFLYDQLCSLTHGNGVAACVVYGPPVVENGEGAHGPVLAFNLRRPTGEYVGYAEVEKLAELHGIQLRTGCFCNPGACQEALGLSSEEIVANLEAGHVCWDDHDIIDGRPTGAIRASFGYMSTWEDAMALLHLINKYFISKKTTTTVLNNPTTLSAAFPALPAASPSSSSIHLTSLIIYPIKSCAGMTCARWPLGPAGLLFDREWAIVDTSGRALRLKSAPSMCLIRPHICLEKQEVVVTAPGMEDLRFSLSSVPPPERSRSVSVCGESCVGVAYEAAISDWFTRYLGQPCTLVRSSPYASQRRQARMQGGDRGEVEDGEGEGRREGGGQERSIAFSNEAQFLLVSTASVDHLNGLIAHQVELDYEFHYQGDKSESYVTIENFRPNLVVSGGVAHQEDLWRSLAIGEEVSLRVTGPCSRCSMVNIDHRDGSKTAPVLKTLATYRRDKSKICFGQFLTVSRVAGEAWLEVGSIIRPVVGEGEEEEVTR